MAYGFMSLPGAKIHSHRNGIKIQEASQTQNHLVWGGEKKKTVKKLNQDGENLANSNP